MENINLVRKLAWSFHKSTGLDWDDLFQEASLAYLLAMETYDPDRGKITTHLWTTIYNSLCYYVERERRVNPPTLDLEEAFGVPTNPVSVKERLPEKVHPVVDLILETDELVAMPPLLARNYIRTMLFKEGWTLEEVREAIRILRLAFS